MHEKEAAPPADRLFAVLVGLGYLLAALSWIGFSDQVGGFLFTSPEALTRFQTYKGIGFVLASSVLVFELAWRPTRGHPQGRASTSRVGIGALLATLVLVTAVPLVAMLGYDVMRQARASAEETDMRIQGLVGATAARFQGYIEDRQALARALARRPQVAALDPGRCDPLLADTVTLHEDIVDILVLDAAGLPACSAAGSQGTPVIAAEVGDKLEIVLGPPAGGGRDPVFAFNHPVRDAGGTVRGSVQLLLNGARLAHIAAGSATSGVTIGMATTRGLLIARAPLLEGAVGRHSPYLLDFAARASSGEPALVARGVDGIERLFAVRNVPGTNVMAVAGVETEATFAPLRWQALRSLGVAGLVVLLAGLAVTLIARRISRPMRALALTAEGVAAGDLDRRAPETGLPEVAQVAIEFNRMLDRLPVLERELRDSEERHRTLIEKLSRNIPGLIFQLCQEPNGRLWFPFVSEGVERMFGVTAAQAQVDGAAVIGRFHPDDQPRAWGEIRRSREELSRVSLQYRVPLEHRGMRHYLTIGRPEMLERGACLWHGCTVDVTALEEARIALREANETLEARVAERTRELGAANESLESFSYCVAHDLRAPLAAIEGFTGALPAALEKGDGARVARLADRVAANTRQMGRMIDGLLAVAGAGKGALHERPLDLHVMVADVLAELRVPPSVTVEAEPLPVVNADAATLRQVWWNLLANAVKFSAHRQPGRIAIGWTRRDSELVFAVHDNGAGFDPQYAGRLFTAFQRLHDASAFEGTGIGLALVRRVVERHGGRVWAEGRLDEGASFFFTLPAGRLVG